MKLRAYQTTDPTFWDDNRIRGLSEQGRMLAIYLLTNPMRSTEGLYGLPVVLARDHLGWSAGKLERAADELREADFATYDLEAGVVFIHRGLKYNAPKGDTQVKGAVKTLDIANLPEPMLAQFLAAADTYAATGTVQKDGSVSTPFAQVIREKFDRASVPPRYPLDGVSRDGDELSPSSRGVGEGIEPEAEPSRATEQEPSRVDPKNYF